MHTSQPTHASSSTETLSSAYPKCPDRLPRWTRRIGAFECGFATRSEDLEAVQRLRFEVFNRELGEGLASAAEFERDEDEFDAVSHHLVVRHVPTGDVVGTYRLLTRELVGDATGFYSCGEFDLSGAPHEVFDAGVELGRACIARGSRGGRILQLMWAGIAAYVFHNEKRFLFGCASMPRVSPGEIAATTRALHQGGFAHAELRVEPLPAYAIADAAPLGEEQIPGLLRAYLSLGARICSPPALDRAFGTVDYFVLLDVADVKPAMISKLTA